MLQSTFSRHKTLDNNLLNFELSPNLIIAVPQTNISNYCEKLYQFIRDQFITVNNIRKILHIYTNTYLIIDL